jgi:hypothetical protein
VKGNRRRNNINNNKLKNYRNREEEANGWRQMMRKRVMAQQKDLEEEELGMVSFLHLLMEMVAYFENRNGEKR